MLKRSTSVRPLMAAVFVFITAIFAVALLLFQRTPELRIIIPTTRPNDYQKPTERFVIAFGDSYSRSGFKMNSTYTRTGPGFNDMERNSQPKRKKPLEGPSPKNPVGNPPFPGSTSSGGNNYITYMATKFNTTLTLAYNFARSGSLVDSGIIPTRKNTTFTYGHQIIHFNDTIGHRPHYAAWTAENTVATIWFGMNDVSRSRSKNAQDSQDIQDEKLKAANRRMFDLTEILYDIGIRNFVFVEVPPLELLPARQKKKTDVSSHNMEQFIYAKTFWNGLLKQNTVLFQQTHYDAKVTYLEVWDLFYRAFLNPGALNVTNSSCIDPHGWNCLWTDSWHPGRGLHRLIGARISERAWESVVI